MPLCITILSVHIAANQSVFANQGMLGVMNLFPQRPIPMITFYFNYLTGGMSPEYFRIVNVALLVIASILVMLLIQLILGLGRQQAEKARPK